MTGEPTYIELGVTDAGAARTFYGALLGWHPSGSSGPGQVDTPTLSVGIHDQDPKTWFEVFFAVDDLHASLAQVTSLGGTIESEVHVEDGFGRWCECADDQGVRSGYANSSPENTTRSRRHLPRRLDDRSEHNQVALEGVLWLSVLESTGQPMRMGVD